MDEILKLVILVTHLSTSVGYNACAGERKAFLRASEANEGNLHLQGRLWTFFNMRICHIDVEITSWSDCVEHCHKVPSCVGFAEINDACYVCYENTVAGAFIQHIFQECFYVLGPYANMLDIHLGFSARRSGNAEYNGGIDLVWNMIEENIGGAFQGTYFVCPITARYEVYIQMITEPGTSMYAHILIGDGYIKSRELAYIGSRDGGVATWREVVECGEGRAIWARNSGVGIYARTLSHGSVFSAYTHA